VALSEEGAAEPPWRAGLRAARANLVPGLILQGVMLALLIAYYLHGPTREALAWLAGIKAAWGFVFSAISAAIAGGVLPVVLRVLVFQRGRAGRADLEQLVFACLFWGGMGLVVDALYRGQAMVFGDSPDWRVVLPQVLVDQFLYSPLFAAPVTVWTYAWKRSGYHWRREWFGFDYYRRRVVPTLFATWGVWIPVVTILYTLPEPLQIPLFALALSLWVTIYTWMSEEA